MFYFLYRRYVIITSSRWQQWVSDLLVMLPPVQTGFICRTGRRIMQGWRLSLYSGTTQCSNMFHTYYTIIVRCMFVVWRSGYFRATFKTAISCFWTLDLTTLPVTGMLLHKAHSAPFLCLFPCHRPASGSCILLNICNTLTIVADTCDLATPAYVMSGRGIMGHEVVER